MQEREFVTRKEGVQLANDGGIPLTIGRVNKDCMDGIGPEPAGKYGPTFLYTREKFMQYARARIRRAVEEVAA